MTAHQAVAFVLAFAVGGCGSAERKAAEAKADSLQRVLQHQQDSLKGAHTQDSLARTRSEDSLKTARERASVQRRREDSLKAAREKATADSINAERSRPRDLAIMNTTGVSIGPQRTQDYAFVLDSDADCAVHGRVEVLSGGTNKDVEVYLFTADDYTNWKNNHPVTPLFRGGRQTVTTLNTGVSQAGEYHLIVSNYFSTLSGKTVKGQVTVTCRGLQPRQS